jgi:hypothetical protein
MSEKKLSKAVQGFLLQSWLLHLGRNAQTQTPDGGRVSSTDNTVLLHEVSTAEVSSLLIYQARQAGPG